MSAAPEPPLSERNAPERERLPERRESDSFTFIFEGVLIKAQFSRYGDARLGELFIDAGKLGSSANVAYKEASTILSVALQFGTPLEVLRKALPELADGSPAGPIGVALAVIAGEVEIVGGQAVRRSDG